MGHFKFEAIIKLYLLGKRIKSQMKNHNRDVMAQALVLWQLNRTATTISELAEMLAIKPSAMSEKIRSMEAEGWVDEVAVEDGRKKSLSLTTKGKGKWQEMRQKMETYWQAHEFGLSSQESKQLVQLMEKIRWERP